MINTLMDAASFVSSNSNSSTNRQHTSKYASMVSYPYHMSHLAK